MSEGAGKWTAGQRIIEHKHPQESLAEYGYRLLAGAEDIEHKRRAAFIFEQSLVDLAGKQEASAELVRQLVATALTETRTSHPQSSSSSSG